MKKLGKLLLEYGIMSVGAILYSIGISMFLDPNNLAPGGVTGIGIILSNFLPVETGTSVLFFAIDFVIVAASAIAFQDIVVALYALVAVGVSSYVLDKVLYGTDEAKLIYIISDCSQPIADKLLNDLGVGATFIQGKGAFSGKNKAIIMVVVRKTLSPKVEEIVKEVDPTAFMIVTSANEIYGEGYKNIFSEKL